MIPQQYHNAELVTNIRLLARAKAKKRLTMITSYIELIVEHCVKLNKLPSHESAQHWQKEVAIAFYNISKIKKPNGNNEDFEWVQTWTEQETTQHQIDIVSAMIELQYPNTKPTIKNLATLIHDFILEQYESILYDGTWTPKSVYDSKHFKKITRQK